MAKDTLINRSSSSASDLSTSHANAPLAFAERNERSQRQPVKGGGATEKRRTTMNMMTSISTVAAFPIATPSLTAPQSKVIQAVERYRLAESIFNEVYDELQEAQFAASHAHGHRPSALIAWRNYSAIGGGEIEMMRDRLLEEGENAQIVGREYKAAKKRYREIIQAGKDWDRKAGLQKLTRREEGARRELSDSRKALGTLTPTSLEDAAALVDLVQKDVEKFEEIQDWEAAALAKANKFLGGAKGSTAITTRGELRPSTVQKLCSQYEATLTAFKSAHDAFVQAENAAAKARPQPDSLICPNRRNFKDVSCNVKGRRIPITSGEIKTQIASLRRNTTKVDENDGTRVFTISKAGFPLTKKQKAQLARVEARLPLAVAYETEWAAVQKRLRVKELEEAAQVPSRRLRPLAARIAETPSKDRQDMLAKARVCEIDPDMAEVAEDIAMSIALDFSRLSAAGLI